MDESELEEIVLWAPEDDEGTEISEEDVFFLCLSFVKMRGASSLFPL